MKKNVFIITNILLIIICLLCALLGIVHNTVKVKEEKEKLNTETSNIIKIFNKKDKVLDEGISIKATNQNNNILIIYKGIDIESKYLVKHTINRLYYNFNPSIKEETLVFRELLDTISVMNGKEVKSTYDTSLYANLTGFNIHEGLVYKRLNDKEVKSIINTKVSLKLVNVEKEKEEKRKEEAYLNRMTVAKTFDFIGKLPVLGNLNLSELSNNFYDQSIKNNADLVVYSKYAVENGWGYVWGTFGWTLSESYFNYSVGRSDYNRENAEFLKTNYLDKRVTDCVGLIKSYAWYMPGTNNIEYGKNGFPDMHADGLLDMAKEKGSISTIPEIPGLGLWSSGHAGVYIGNGKGIEAMNIKKGVQVTTVKNRSWTHWFKIPYITYYE
ncbi:MAG: hypothetical protein RR228_03490 [Bacilli bacterium]